MILLQCILSLEPWSQVVWLTINDAAIISLLLGSGFVFYYNKICILVWIFWRITKEVSITLRRKSHKLYSIGLLIDKSQRFEWWNTNFKPLNHRGSCYMCNKLGKSGRGAKEYQLGSTNKFPIIKFLTTFYQLGNYYEESSIFSNLLWTSTIFREMFNEADVLWVALCRQLTQTNYNLR